MADGLPPELLDGFLLTQKDARALEEDLLRRPDDVSARTRLLVWHAQAALDSAEHALAASVHALWLIAHAPHAPVLATPFGIPPDEGAAAHAGQLWRAHVEDQPRDPVRLAHAARFFSQLDRPFAEQLRYRLQLVDRALWEVFPLDYPLSSGEARSRPSLQELEDVLAEAEEPLDALGALRDVVEAAFACGAMERAEEGARALLSMVQRAPAQWQLGDAAHLSHGLLGHRALDRGDVEEARRHLRASAEVSPTPRLESFGPDMGLCARLLDLGERACALDYIERVRPLWKMGQARIGAWEVELRAGGRPTFVGQLRLVRGAGRVR
jgi:tetratricopeptide (TPR) repeat protein